MCYLLLSLPPFLALDPPCPSSSRDPQRLQLALCLWQAADGLLPCWLVYLIPYRPLTASRPCDTTACSPPHA